MVNGHLVRNELANLRSHSVTKSRAAMEFHVMARTYNAYGGHTTLSSISELLLEGAPHIGSAISELTLAFNFPHSGPPRPTLEPLFERYRAYRATLPKVVFRRNSGKARIDIASSLIDGKDWDAWRGVSLPLFESALPEAISALALLKPRLKAQDDFDLESLLDHCRGALSRVPRTKKELVEFTEEVQRRRLARFAAKSPWEKLDIDWGEFHDDARKVLDDPFFWQDANDFSPHGNDTGADLLAAYRKWFKRNPSGDPLKFYRNLIRAWGFESEAADDMHRTVVDEAAVALAFAEFKLKGKCAPAIAEIALAAIRRQRQSGEAEFGRVAEERLASLKRLDAKLRNACKNGL
jgi:uncharacterized protein YfeS